VIQAFSAPEIIAMGGCCAPITVDPNGSIYLTQLINTSEVHEVGFWRAAKGAAKFDGPISLGTGAITTVAEDSGGKIYDLWNDHDSTFYLSRSDDGGTTFTTPTIFTVPLSFTGFVQMAVDPGSNIDVLADGFAANTGTIYFTRSTDGGHSFSASVQVSAPSSTPSLGASGAEMAIGPDGTISVAWGDENGNRRELWYSRSTDGSTFSAPVKLWIALTDGGGTTGNPHIAIDSQSHVFVTFAAETGIVVCRSADGGADFSAAQTISTIPEELSSSSGEDPRIAVDSSGHIYIAWQGVSASGTHVYFTHSIDGGATFSSAMAVDNARGGSSLTGASWPSLAIDASGDIDIAWLDNSGGSCFSCSDVYFGQSTDGGASFAKPINVSNQIGTKWSPDVAVEPDGSVYIFWTSYTDSDQTLPFSTTNLRFSQSIVPGKQGPLALSISACCGPTGVSGNAYLGTVTATGGTPPFSLQPNGLPPGLFIAEGASFPGPSWGILGTPAAAGSFAESFIVKDSAGLTATADVTEIIGGTGSGWVNVGNQSIGSQADSGDSNRISMFAMQIGAGGGALHAVNIYIGSPVDPAPNNQFQIAIYADNRLRLFPIVGIQWRYRCSSRRTRVTGWLTTRMEHQRARITSS